MIHEGKNQEKLERKRIFNAFKCEKSQSAI